MNIKKKTTKLMSLMLSFAMAFSGVIPAYAMENTNSNSTTVIDGKDISVDERNLEDITVTYKQASSFFVTIPKTIVLDGWKQSTYAVKVSGDIDAEQCVYVAPVDMIDETENIDFYMKDQASENAKDNVVANVTHNKFHWNSAEVAEGHKQDDNLVSALDLTAGAWRGIFQMEIRLETKKAHEHNYVDGKCECGAIDPNHTYNYGEDGKCTICGKENDPYETAPASAYSNWDYTLDDENGIITLNYYKGAETDAIVYANYVVDGKTYKTQIASNSSDATYSTRYMFNGDAQTYCQNIKSIIFSDSIDTSNVTDMSYMFNHCYFLTDLDISSFDTSNVTNMACMFNNCQNITSLNVGSFDTRKVTIMERMFCDCQSLMNLDLSNFDTRNVTNMSCMFYVAWSLTDLNLSNFDTNNVTDMSYMFAKCADLTSLDLSSFDTNNVTNMNYMFWDCKLKTIYATEGKWSTSQATTSGMFYSCSISSVTYK